MLIIKQGDTHNAIQSQLTKNGDPIDLTDCEVFISVSDIVFEDKCVITDEDQGKVAYPLSNISDNAGFHNYEFIIKYKDGTKEIVPNSEFNKIRIVERIGDNATK